MKNNEKNKKTNLANSILRGVKNKNAFTLIELLAIIVILAIIAVITVPIILNVIDNAKKGSIKDSAYGFKDAVNKYYVSELYENENIKLNGTYLVENDGTMQGMDLDSNSYTDKLDISVSGTTPTGGYLNYENSILKDGCLTMDEYKVTIENGEVTKTEKGSCESASLTACDSPNFKSSPEEWFTFDASTNTITGFSDAWDGTTDITIPCQIDGVDVVNIRGGSFSGKSLTSVVIGDRVEVINGGSFSGNQFSSVIIGDGVKTIGGGSFNESGIKVLKLGNSVEFIDGGAFTHNLIEELILPDSVITINAAFSFNKIKKIKLGMNLETIGAGAFAGNQLTEVIIPSKVVSIGDEAFWKSQTTNFNTETNPNLKTIYNNTGKSFDWGSIINGPSGYNFETGIVENELGNVEIKKSN